MRAFDGWGDGAIGRWGEVRDPSCVAELSVFHIETLNLSRFIKPTVLTRASWIDRTSNLGRASIIFTGNVADNISYTFYILALWGQIGGRPSCNR